VLHGKRGPASVGHLLALIADETAHTTQHEEVVLNSSQIAALDAIELARLGLPPPAPYRLCIRGAGLLSSPSFRFHYQLLTDDGRPVLGAQREGPLLAVGNRRYTLLDPLFSLITGMDTFNETPPADLDERFTIWAELKRHLPADAVIDEHLRTMNIVRSDAFTLDFTDNGTFHPVLLSRGQRQEPSEEPPTPFDQSLPPEPQASFVERFHRLPVAQRRYVVEGGWYVVIGEHLHKALKVVREYQDRPLVEQRAFAANPQAILAERLADDLAEDDLEVLFQETPEFLSARVRHLGKWRPKVCAYIMPSRQTWLPPEDLLLGVPAGGAIYQVQIKDLPKIIEKLHNARERGEQEIEFGGQRILVDDETLEAFARVVGGSPKSTRENTSDGKEKQAPALVPVIIDNLEELGFETSPVPRRGEIGGIPAPLHEVQLYPHQTEGLEWLQTHWASGSSGALLADDMGLGKTLQTLGFLAWVQEQMARNAWPRKPFLVVAPTGLLKNWEAESRKHLASPGLGILVRAYGPHLKRLLHATRREQTQKLFEADWVLTTYETLRDRIRIFLSVDWGVLVLDEAQKIKNPAARLTEMAKSIKADFTLALTGTPVENRLADLWSIVDAIRPGFLGALKDFHQDYEKPAFNTPEAAAPLAGKLTRDTRPPLMLRRMKEDHLHGLPEKRESVIEELMPPEQASAYEEALRLAAHSKGQRGMMLEVLHRLRRISLLAGELGAEGLTDADVARSARLSATMRVLDDIAEAGEKALLFVEFLDMQEVLIPYLQRRYGLSRPPLRISGTVSGHRRQARIDEFQAGAAGEFDVMLLSPKAGGVGLTLTAANHVIHLTRWWNPAVEDQCTDRVYRIGQMRTVHVHLPLAIHPRFGQHSFDKNLHALLESKRRLSRTVLAPPSASDEDLARLYRSSVENI